MSKSKNKIPYREQQFHPIRWIGKMSGYLDDHFYQTYPETADIIMQYEDQNPDPVDFSKPLDRIFEEADFGYPIKEDWFTYTDEVFSDVLRFFRKGQNIFQLRPELCEMFMQTDVNNVSINDIKLPFETFYLHFGNAGATLWGDFHLDGVYIYDLTTEDDGQAIGLNFIASQSPNVYPESSGPEIVFEHEAHLSMLIEYHAADGWETIKDNLAHLFEIPSNWTSLEDENLSLWKPYLDDIFSLVVNAILFINTRPEDVEETYSETTPEALAEKARKARQRNDEKTAKRTESKITSQGFSKVKLVGRKVAESLKMSRDSHSKRSHWRRGHWRRQKHGENLSEEKLIWIQPTLVAAGNDEHPEIKHVYDVDNQNNQS